MPTSKKNHRNLGKSWDGPIAAFLGDLKQSGLLDSTLGSVGRRIWQNACGRKTAAQWTGPQSLWIYMLAGGWWHKGRRVARRDR